VAVYGENRWPLAVQLSSASGRFIAHTLLRGPVESGLSDLVTMKREAGRTVDLEDLAKLKVAHGELRETDPSA
jgi:hypothetical protein